MPRVYCTEGTPRLISRASSVGDLTGNDKRRPETIYEQEEITLASRTATANATPRIWSGNGSPTSMNSFCMNGNSQFDAHSIVSEFSRQPSGLISPSDLPDSPGQTMPPSPKECRPAYTNEAKHPFDFAYPLQSTSHIPQAARFTPIALDEVKHDVKSTPLNLVRPNPEPRQMRSYADSKSLMGDQYTQEDSLHNYRTEDTPANLSAATSFSDLSSICPKSDCHGPVPKPRTRMSKTPSQGCSPLPTPLDLYSPVEDAAVNGHAQMQHQDNAFIMDDQKSETSSSLWKPRTLPRKLRDSLPMKDMGSSSSSNHNKSMPDLNKKPVDSPPESDDGEILKDMINKGRPNKKESSSSKSTQNKGRSKQASKDFDSDSESDQQQILNELIKLGRPTSRNQTLKLKSKPEQRDDEYPSSSSSKDKFKNARSMESLSVAPKVVKKGATAFRVQEQPIRGGEAVIPKSAVARAQSLKGNKTLGYDPVHDRRQTKTPDPTDPSKFDLAFMNSRSSKPISKVSPMRSSPKKYPDEDEEPQKSVLLSPLRSSVRQSRQTCVKKTVELSGEASDASSEDTHPPLPPKPPHFRAVPKPPAESPEPVVAAAPEVPVVAMPDVVQRDLPDIVSPGQPAEEENNNNVPEVKIDVPPEPPEDSGDITVLSFKFTDSHRSYTRRFLTTNQFHCVLNYLACKGFPSDKYKVVVPTVLRIKKEVTESNYGKTLSELKMVPKKTLTVKPR